MEERWIYTTCSLLLPTRLLLDSHLNRQNCLKTNSKRTVCSWDLSSDTVKCHIWLLTPSMVLPETISRGHHLSKRCLMEYLILSYELQLMKQKGRWESALGTNSDGGYLGEVGLRASNCVFPVCWGYFLPWPCSVLPLQQGWNRSIDPKARAVLIKLLPGIRETPGANEKAGRCWLKQLRL